MRVALVFIIFFALSCKNDQKEEYYHVFENKQWNTDSIVKFEMENTDTSLTYDLYAMIRHTTNYRFQNLFLFTEIQSKKDTLEIILSEKNGKWRGKGFW